MKTENLLVDRNGKLKAPTRSCSNTLSFSKELVHCIFVCVFFLFCC